MADLITQGERSIETLFGQAAGYVGVVDLDHRWVCINRVDFGIPRERVIGQLVEDGTTPENRDRVSRVLDSVIETGRPATFDVMIEIPGETIRMVTRVSPIYQGDEIVRLALITTREDLGADADRDEVSGALVQAQRMHSLGQLTGGVAHDFNNLLTAMLANLEVAREANENAVVATRLEEAKAAVDRAAALTRQLLAFARRQTLNPRTVDLGPTVEKLRDLLRRLLSERIQLDIDTQRVACSCNVDVAQLEVGLMNLVLNSRDAMPRGGTIRITLDAYDASSADAVHGLAPGRYARITVEDDGAGMSPAIRSQALEPFFTTKPVGDGSGLGLSTVYGFAQQSGGGLRLSSQEGEGTRVELFLPVVAAEVGEVAEVAPREEGSVTQSGETLLLVEDDPRVREAAAFALEQSGYRVLRCVDANQALQVAARTPTLAAVISDVVLPGALNGFDLGARLQESRPTLPVIYMSGYAGGAASDFEDGSKVPEVLAKPFTVSELRGAVHRALAVRA